MQDREPIQHTGSGKRCSDPIPLPGARPLQRHFMLRKDNRLYDVAVSPTKQLENAEVEYAKL